MRGRAAGAFEQRIVEPGGQERIKPGRNVAVMLEPAAQMLMRRTCPRPPQAFRAARRPTAHHLVSDFWMKLQSDRVAAIAERLVRKFRAATCQQLGALRQIEAIEMPLINEAGKSGGA